MDTKIIKLENSYGYQRVLGGEPQTSGMKSGRLILKPGESVGEHSTGSREEAIVIMEGEAEIISDGKTKEKAQANTVVYFPPDTKHDIKNIGTDDLKYVYVVSPVAS